MKANYIKPNRDWADIVFVAFMAILGVAFLAGAITTAGPTVVAEGAKLFKSVQKTEQSQQTQRHLPEEDRVAANQGSTSTPTCVPECDEPTGPSYSPSSQPLDPSPGTGPMWREDDPQLCIPLPP